MRATFASAFALSFFCSAAAGLANELEDDGIVVSSRSDKFSYINFVENPFHHLDVNPIVSSSVTESSQCAWACVETVTCFSFNVAAQPDIEGRTLCELLPTDKYNASDKFKANSSYHHYSTVSFYLQTGQIVIRVNDRPLVHVCTNYTPTADMGIKFNRV